MYLIFNEGYSAETTGTELSREAIRLGRLLLDLLQLHRIREPEVMGLVGLIMLQESRRAARTSPDGDLILTSRRDVSASEAPFSNEDSLTPPLAFMAGQSLV